MPSQTLPDLKTLSEFAASFVRLHPGGGVFLLRGELGAGKTSFVREVIHVLSGGSSPRVVSPTYLIHQLYDIPPSVDHFDLYRFDRADDPALMEIGFFEAVERAQEGGFVFVEWPERMALKRPISASTLDFRIREEGREITWD